MSEIIHFVTGEELASLLGVMGQQVSGMTPQEAYNALHMVESGKMVSGNVTTGGNKIIEFTPGSAADAVNGYIENGGAVSSTGAATSSSSTTANLTVVKGAAGATGVAGILTMSVPTWAAVAAPLLGVSLGAGLYSLNPDFWEKVSRTLLPFAWSDTQAMPGVVDANGQVYIEAQAIEAYKQLLLAEGIIGDKESVGDNITVNGNALQTPIMWSNLVSGNTWQTSPKIYRSGTGDAYFVFDSSIGNLITATYCTYSGGNPVIIISSKTNLGSAYFSFRYANGEPAGGSSTIYPRILNIDGKMAYVYIYSPTGNFSPYVPSSGYYQTEGNPTSNTFISIGWYSLYGDSKSSVTGIEGVTEWGGEPVTDPSVGKIDVLTNSEGNLAPYYPVTLPVGDIPPGTSNDPEKVPVPTVPTPLPEITPYIPPVVNPNQYPVEIPYPDGNQNSAPITDPVPNTNPNLDPNADPSKQPESAPDPEPSQENNPSSGGSSPPAIFPPIGAFPSIIPSSGSGLIHVYNPTPEEMISFGHWLWVTYADADIQKLWNNPFDGVISAHELYATPSVDGRDNIRSGFLVCPTSANLVRVRYNQINCGSIVIPEWYANYLDYSPYTKASVYLPFIGIVELDSDDIVGHGINITYTIDSYNGSCIAQITVAKQGYNNTVYQFSGNCSVELPLAGGSQAAIKAGMISAAATGITSVIGGVASLLTGNVPGAIGGIAHGVGSAVSTAVSQKSTVQHSGSFGASYGAMGIKKPYLIIRRPIQKQVVNYNEEYGFPAHKRVLIGSCSGYLRAKEVHVVSPTATDEEKAMIERLLKQGVFVS